MKLIIAGSRHFEFGYRVIEIALSAFPDLKRSVPGFFEYDKTDTLTEIVSGGAKGIDSDGEKWAEASFWSMPGRAKPKLTIFKADWNLYGKAAGHVRNKQMAEYADALLLIWDGKSPGSANMKSEMQKLNKPIFEITLKSHNNSKETT